MAVFVWLEAASAGRRRWEPRRRATECPPSRRPPTRPWTPSGRRERGTPGRGRGSAQRGREAGQYRGWLYARSLSDLRGRTTTTFEPTRQYSTITADSGSVGQTGQRVKWVTGQGLLPVNSPTINVCKRVVICFRWPISRWVMLYSKRSRLEVSLQWRHVHHLTTKSTHSFLLQARIGRMLVVTSSSAVAERPRDALCPSAVSLNKRITRADSFIIVT